MEKRTTDEKETADVDKNDYMRKEKTISHDRIYICIIISGYLQDIWKQKLFKFFEGQTVVYKTMCEGPICHLALWSTETGVNNSRLRPA